MAKVMHSGTGKAIERKRLRTSDALVVGAGPAGLTAAIQLVRQGIQTVVLEKGSPGGQIRTANIVENYPGMHGMSGKEVAEEFVRHADIIGVNIRNEEVLGIHRDLTVVTNMGQWHARVVIAATGAAPLRIGVGAKDALVELERPGELKGKNVFILGGGDAAFDRALRLKGIASSVTIICRAGTSALELLVGRARKAGVRVVRDAGTVKPITSGKGVQILTGKGVFSGDALLLCIGKRPDLSILPRPLEKLSVHRLTGETNIGGLFIVGDAMTGDYRQLGTAVGTALAAAMRAGKYLKDKYSIRVTRPEWE
jgi:thioredoxin reductase (NADPH)